MSQEQDGIGAQNVPDPPKTIHSEASTISCRKLSEPKVASGSETGCKNERDPPKTIHRDGDTASGRPSVCKKRGRGAPPGNLNALKTGRYTAQTKAKRKEIWEFTSHVESFIRCIEELHGFRIRRYRCDKHVSPVLSDKLRRIYRERARK